MELTIDSKPCDLAGEPIAVGGYAAAELADVEAAREGRSQEFTLPATPRNEALLGFARDPHTSGRFNASLHRAVLSAEGAKLLAGTVRLLKVSDEGYRIEIREGGARWAKNAARRVFSALGIDYHARLLPSTVSASWTDDSPVKFSRSAATNTRNKTARRICCRPKGSSRWTTTIPSCTWRRSSRRSSQRPATASKAISRAVRSSARFT